MFLAEVNIFKKQSLTSYTTDNVNKSNKSDSLIITRKKTLLLKEQIKVIYSLLNQLSTSNTVSTQTELITDSKLKESSKKSERSNTERE